MTRPLNLTDDQGRKSEYTLNTIGVLGSARFNETYDANSNLLSYCQADYTYDASTGTPPPVNGGTPTRFRLVEIKNTWNWKNASGQWQQSVLCQNDYTYDLAGQRLTNQLSNVSGPVRTESYGYDEINRLTSVNYGDGQTQSYTFDPMGNRTQKQDSVNGTENSTYNAANMLLTRGSSGYTNDSNGNTLSGGGRTSTWDSQNRLAQCVYNRNTSVYTYAADGQRHRSAITSGGTTTTTDFVLDASMFVREMRSGANYATYLVGPRGPEYRRDDTTGNVRWYCYDGLGSVLGEVDPNGNLTASRSYDVYGSVHSSAGTSTSKHKFCGALGHPSDDETGLIYMRARYMDPVTGRFISEDPAQHDGNWYLYASDNPTNRIDRDGKVDEELIAAALVMIAIGYLGSETFRAMLWYMLIPLTGASADPNLIKAIGNFLYGLGIRMTSFERQFMWGALRSGNLVKQLGPLGAAKEVVCFYTGYAGMVLLFIEAIGSDVRS